MTWVYIFIAFGALAFLIYIVIEYLNAASGLRPKADAARQEIRECETRIETEQAATGQTKEEVDGLQKEIGELEKEAGELAKQVEEYQQKERRRKPTRFQLDE